jgi:hypothetical protein
MRSFYWLRAVLSQLFCLAVILLSSTCFGQQPKVMAPHKPVAPRLEKQRPWASPMVRQSALGGLWLTSPSMKSSLYLRNDLKTDSLTVTPIIYLSNGTRYALRSVSVEPTGTAVVDIGKSLEAQGVASYAKLYGYAEIEYQWPWAVVCATIKNVDVANSLIFSYGLQPPLESFPAQASAGQQVKTVNGPTNHSFEGLWWKQEKNVTGFLGLANTSAQVMNASVRITDNGGTEIGSHQVAISPHGTKMIDLSEIKLASMASGGIYLSHDGAEHTLAISGGLSDDAVGFSAHLVVLPVSETGNTEVSTVTYAELGLMSGFADPMMSFPSGTVFSPYSFIRNISNGPARVTPTLWWMSAGAAHSFKGSELTIPSHQTMNLDVPALISTAGLEHLNGSLNLVLDMTAQVGSLTMSSGSVDQKNTYVFEVIPRGIQESAAKSISYWSVDSGDDTMFTFWNPADEDQDLVFTLYFSGHYGVPIHLAARASLMFNVSEVTRSATPDAEGNIIPAGVHEGSAEIAGSMGENEHILISEDAGIYNINKAVCTPTCITCQGMVSTSLFASPYSVPMGGSTQQTFSMQWSGGIQYDLTKSSTWSTSAPTVATVNLGLVNGVSVGAADIGAFDSNFEPPYIVGFCYFGGNGMCPQGGPSSGSAPGGVRQLYAAKLVATVFSQPMSGCLTGSGGWDRKITADIVDQNGNPWTISGVTMTETVTIARNDFGLKCSTGCSGTTTTDSAGDYGDHFSFCNFSCPSSTTKETDFTQVDYFNGIPVHNTNLLVYKCKSITWNGQ